MEKYPNIIYQKKKRKKYYFNCKKVKGLFVGVDFIPTKEGPKVIEVNHSHI